MAERSRGRPASGSSLLGEQTHGPTVCVQRPVCSHQRQVRGLPTMAGSWHAQDLRVWLWPEINPCPRRSHFWVFLALGGLSGCGSSTPGPQDSMRWLSLGCVHRCPTVSWSSPDRPRRGGASALTRPPPTASVPTQIPQSLGHPASARCESAAGGEGPVGGTLCLSYQQRSNRCLQTLAPSQAMLCLLCSAYRHSKGPHGWKEQ